MAVGGWCNGKQQSRWSTLSTSLPDLHPPMGCCRIGRAGAICALQCAQAGQTDPEDLPGPPRGCNARVRAPAPMVQVPARVACREVADRFGWNYRHGRILRVTHGGRGLGKL